MMTGLFRKFQLASNGIQGKLHHSSVELLVRFDIVVVKLSLGNSTSFDLHFKSCRFWLRSWKSINGFSCFYMP